MKKAYLYSSVAVLFLIPAVLGIQLYGRALLAFGLEPRGFPEAGIAAVLGVALPLVMASALLIASIKSKD